MFQVSKDPSSNAAVLQAAQAETLAAGIHGSSTVCIALVDLLQGRLNCANLGDSGCLVVGRTSRQPHMHIKWQTPQQEHGFGCPFQLGHHANADKAEDAMLASVQVHVVGGLPLA